MVPDRRHARLVAVTELRRRWRDVRSNRLQLAAIAVAGVFYLAVVAVAVGGGYVAGRALARGRVDDALTYARYGAAAALVGPAFFTAFRTIARLGNVDALDGLLTTIPHEDLAAGLLAAEGAWLAATFGAPVLPAAVALAAGSGSATLGAAALGATLALGALGLVGGFALGFAVRTLLARSAFLARHRTALGTLVFAAYMGLLVTHQVASVAEPVLEAARVSPVGWYGDLVLLPLGAGADPALAAVAVAGTPVAAVALFGAATRLAGAYWYGDHARGPTGETRSGGLSLGLVDGVALGLPRPAASVASKSWRRALRAPIKLAYVLYPLFVLVGPAGQAVEEGAVPVTLPPLVALYGAWATGAAFTLNPLGDEGAVLPVTLTTPVAGRQFVGGLVAAGAVVGAPVTATASLAVGVASPLGAVAAAATGVAGAVLAVCAAAIAAGAGTLFPKFETTNITRSRSAVVPSLYAFGLYSVVLAVAWAPAGVAAFAAGPAGEWLGVAPAAVATAGLAVTGAVGITAGAVGFRYAVRSFESFRL